MKLFVIVVLLSMSGCVLLEDKSYIGHDYRKDVLFTKGQFVDSLMKYGDEYTKLLFADTFLVPRMFHSPMVYILNEKGEVMDLNVCNANFPDFQNEVIVYLNDTKIDEETTKLFHQYFNHLTFFDSVPYRFLPKKKYTVFLGFGSKGYGRSDMGYYLKDILKSDTSLFETFCITDKNYQELRFDNWEFTRRRLVLMSEEGMEFPKEVREEFGLK